MNKPSSLKKQQELAKKHDMSVETIHAVIKSQFEFVAMTISAGNREKREFKTVLLARLGRFVPSMTRLNWVTKLSESKKKNGLTNNRGGQVEPVAICSDDNGV